LKENSISSSFLCCPLKRRRKRSPYQEFPPPIDPDMLDNSSESIPNDTIDLIRPPSSQSTKDVQLNIISTPKEKPKPHYTLALNRSPRVSPLSSSLTSIS
jgi:hypothetical protein